MELEILCTPDFSDDEIKDIEQAATSLGVTPEEVVLAGRCFERDMSMETKKSNRRGGLQIPGWVKKRRLVHVWKHAVRVARKFSGRDELVGEFACEYTDRYWLAGECERLRELMRMRRGGEIGDSGGRGTASGQWQERKRQMGHKLPKKVKIIADTAKSCERMRKRLIEALEIIEKARDADGAAMAEGRIGSWASLSAAIGALRVLMRPAPDTLPWHTEIDYYLDCEPRLRWVEDIPPLVPGSGEGLSAIEFINGKSGQEGRR